MTEKRAGTETTKKCVRCGVPKLIAEYYIDRRSSDGLFSSCKKCTCAAAKRLSFKYKDRIKRIQKEWYTKNKTLTIGRSKQWKKENPEQSQVLARKYQAGIRNTLKGKLNSNISYSVWHSLKKRVKANRHWEELVGFTINQLKKHLEKRFKPGMTWENYGKHWHIDHKVPIAVFNFERPEDIDFRLCWSLKNLQPLEAKENIRKSDNLDKPFQASLAIAGGTK